MDDVPAQVRVPSQEASGAPVTVTAPVEAAEADLVAGAEVGDRVLLILLVEVDFKSEHDHGDEKADESGNEDAAQRREGDSLRVVQGWAQTAQSAVPVLGRQRLEVS